ncbi:gp436 family protein [Phaeobacter sp. 11ANDIMAR09]|uniref:gp436 family protein n=1 Tax=Phaeobacter sp. 11ANDIMAR09 TaxID=1225647 RepID=UPI0006C8ABBA|nr:DUF1320 domain-containing protein [Phaeobacter sp. 11ANDIMAR09]KPD10867.1 hypothetical protein AN476_18610 [Phaeobacter sp. 11ANDIMAR09]
MDYTSQQELETRYGRRLLVDLTDRSDEPTGVIDAAIVSAAITSAQALVDGFLANHYALPLAEVPDLVAKVTRALVIYELHIYDAPEKIAAEEKKARETLKGIGEGKIRLPIAGVEPAEKPENDVRFTKRERPMSADSMKSYI